MAHPNIDERRKFVWERMESNAEVRAGITPGEIVEWADKFAVVPVLSVTTSHYGGSMRQKTSNGIHENATAQWTAR